MAARETTTRAGLDAEARRRFGDARAAALSAQLDALAEELARVAMIPLPPGTEPGCPRAEIGTDPPLPRRRP